MNGPDHFSHQSAEYSLYRPTYPDKLFQFLAKLCLSTDTAWDCATGNVQAAIGLTPYFRNIIASDTSSEQISRAQPHEKIDYLVACAERSGIESASIDLIMVAQALHWFDFEAFYREAKRVLKPDGVLVVVSYQLPRINPDIDAIIDGFHSDILGKYWPPERRHVDTAYRDIPFPLQEITPPWLEIEHDWTLTQFLGYLRSWSAVVQFEKEQKQNPIDLIKSDLSALWPAADPQKCVCWPLTIRIGKFPKN